MKPKLIIICILLAGCVNTHQLTEDQANQIATKYKIKAPIVWKSDRGNPWQDGYTIFCDLKYVAKYGLSHRLEMFLQHEQGHIDGYDHCQDRKCLMWPEHNFSKTKKICGNCNRTTAGEWLFRGIR